MTVPASRLDERERRDRLRLMLSEGVGPVTCAALLRRYGCAGAALAALPELARRGGRRDFPLASAADAERELAAATRHDARWLAWGEPDYPAALAAIADPPPLIAIRGDLDLLARPALAIVGARNASAAGRSLARRLAADVGATGWTIVSGLARGIDAAAHQGALATGTVAALAGGIDIVYPPEHESLQDAVAAQGLLVSEMPFGTLPRAGHFPRRNRIIAGLARGVLVVEAAAQSGSLITARLALEQGREVLAVPGSPLDPRARGPNDLLRQGATLVETADDVLAAFAPLDAFRPAAPAPGPAASESPADDGPQDLGDGQARIIELLSPTPISVDDLVRLSHLTPTAVLTILLELELAGRLIRVSGQRVAAKEHGS